MDLYLGLEPFPEVPAVLARPARGGVPNRHPLQRLARDAGRRSSTARLEAMFDAILSVDAVGVFKTHPRSTSMRWTRSACRRRDRLPVLERLGRPRGFRLRHARRLVQPLRPAPRTPARRPDFEIRTLADLPALLGRGPP